MSVTINSCEAKTTANGKAYKSIELSNGVKATAWPTVGTGAKSFSMPGYDQLRTGSVGNAEITTQEKGDKTYHNIISWTETDAPSERPSSTEHSGSMTAKDRLIALQNAYTGACTVVAALINSGKVKDVGEAIVAVETLKTTQYGHCFDAYDNKLVYPGFDVFADE